MKIIVIPFAFIYIVASMVFMFAGMILGFFYQELFGNGFTEGRIYSQKLRNWIGKFVGFQSNPAKQWLYDAIRKKQ